MWTPEPIAVTLSKGRMQPTRKGADCKTVPLFPANSPFHGVECSVSDPTDPFETWLLHRVAEAVEAAEVSADLLADIHAAMAET
jgi:hypothetical protein